MTATNRPLALIEKLAAAWPVEKWRDVTVLVAVSGGADSVALATALSELRPSGEGRLVLAHYNHRLRGAESDADQALVEEIGRKMRLEVIVGAGGGEGEIGRGGDGTSTTSEDSLRLLRYQFLVQAASQYGARYVATAHTADDQVETVLFNILRGTGLAGLAGIPRVRTLTEAATLVRPLLDVSRDEVLEYLQRLGKSFREDSSNASSRYTRNRIRHELLPLLEQEYHPNVRQSIARLSRIAEEADQFVDARARRLLSRYKRLFGDDVEIDTRPLRRSPDLVARAALMLIWRWQGWPLADMSFEKWDQLLAIAREPATVDNPRIAPRMFPGGIRAERQGEILRLRCPKP